MANNWYSDFYKNQNKEKLSFEEKEEIKKSEIKLLVKKLNELNKKEIAKKEKEDENKKEIEISDVVINIEKKPGKINKEMVFWISLFIVALIILLLYSFPVDNMDDKNGNVINISVLKATGLPMDVYYDNIKIMTLSGWETKIGYSNKTDRLFGDENYKTIIFDNNGAAYVVSSLDNEIKIEPLRTNPENITDIGWFKKTEQISVTEKASENKTIDVKLSNGEREIKNVDLKYFLYSNQSFFKVKMDINSQNKSELNDIAYGFLINKFDIYLSNGSILKNDNKIVVFDNPVNITFIKNKKIEKNIPKGLNYSLSKIYDLNRKAILRNGSFYRIDGEYEIFFNAENKKAVLIYSPDVSYFENSFYWDAYWIHMNRDVSESPLLYFFIFDNPKLRYDNELGDWNIDIEGYSGEIMFYIYEKIYEMENDR